MANTMMWLEFHNKGTAVVNPAVWLGVMPQGQFLNGMEIVFQEDDAAAARRAKLIGNCSYRVRQTLEEHDFQFVGGQWIDWTAKAAGTADDPAEDSHIQAWDPPFLRALDTPGWSAWAGVGPSSPTLIAKGVKSDPNATEIWIQQVFATWAEGKDCFSGNWSAASTKIVWHNSLHLIRDNPTALWKAGSNCRIDHGPMKFGSTALL